LPQIARDVNSLSAFIFRHFFFGLLTRICAPIGITKESKTQERRQMRLWPCDYQWAQERARAIPRPFLLCSHRPRRSGRTRALPYPPSRQGDTTEKEAKEQGPGSPAPAWITQLPLAASKAQKVIFLPRVTWPIVQNPGPPWGKLTINPKAHEPFDVYLTVHGEVTTYSCVFQCTNS
jgi:hypothetical protein